MCQMDTIPIWAVALQVSICFSLFLHFRSDRRQREKDVELRQRERGWWKFHLLCLFFGCIDWCQGFGAFWHIIFFPFCWSGETWMVRERTEWGIERTVSTSFLHGTMNTKHRLKCVHFCCYAFGGDVYTFMWNCLKREPLSELLEFWDVCTAHILNDKTAAMASHITHSQ